jgi:hypothetical protein
MQTNLYRQKVDHSLPGLLGFSREIEQIGAGYWGLTPLILDTWEGLQFEASPGK